MTFDDAIKALPPMPVSGYAGDNTPKPSDIEFLLCMDLLQKKRQAALLELAQAITAQAKNF